MAGDIWAYKDRSGHVRETELWLYPELDGSAVVGDYCDESGDDQLDAYVRDLQSRHPEWMQADAVPIYWSVKPVAEHAPFSSYGRSGDENFLKFYSWPVNARTGEPANWFAMEVRHSRFPEFGQALGWLPSPLQPTAPLQSILAHCYARRPML